VVAVFALGLLLLDLALLASDARSGFTFGDVTFAIGLVFFGWLLLASIQQIRRPMPVITLDDEAIEGAFGREPWANVERISFRWRWRGRSLTRLVVLHLQPGSPAPAPATRDYRTGLLYAQPEMTARKIEIPGWAYGRRIVSNLRRFYAGPIED
jgi:hypothetical protein